MTSTASSPPPRQGSGSVDISQYQSQNSNAKATATGVATSPQGRSPTGIKSLSFLKNHHPQQSTLETAPLDTSSTHHQKSQSLKAPSKNKPSKQDHTSTHTDYPSPQPASGVASFNAIFRPQAKGVNDERIMLEEWLQKRSSSLQMVWKRRWCVLRDDRLYYYRTNVDTKPLGVLHLADFSILTTRPDVSKKSKFTFRLSSSEAIPHEHQHHMFHTETLKALELWVDAIQSHINHALAHVESLGALDMDLKRERERFVSLSSPTDDVALPKGEQSIIDKVLDRLKQVDPTLSDMNDPSTLIMPAQEHATPPSYQHPTQRSFKELQISLDDNLDGWSASSTLYITATTTATSNINASSILNQYQLSSALKSSADSLSSQRSPIAICSASHGALNSSGSLSATSSLTDSQSNYSSYSEISLSGNSVTKNNRGSMQAPDYQGRPSHQHGRGNQGHRSGSSSVTSQSQQNTQSPTPHSHLGNGQVFAIETGAMSPPSSAPSSPVTTPKMGVFIGSAAAAVAAAAGASLSGYTVPHSPRSLFYRADSAPPLNRTGSNASSNSISTISSTSGDANGLGEAVDEKGLLMSPLDFDLKKIKSSNNPGAKESNGSDNISLSNKPPVKGTIISRRKYCTDNDFHPVQIVEREEKEAASAKKPKKLWSVYGSSSQPPASDKIINGGGNKKTTSDSQGPNNAMYKGLVLISTPSKKTSSRSDSGSSSTKGFSKSMSSLSKRSEMSASFASITRPLAHDDAHFLSRTRSPSVSVIDDAVQSATHGHSQNSSALHRPTVSDILSSQTTTLTKSPGASTASQQDVFAASFNHRTTQKHPSAALGQKYVTAPISLSASNWALFQRKPQLCVDPELEEHGYQVIQQAIAQSVSRHIVAPDELTMAIDQEVEERRQRQEQAWLKWSLETSKRPISIIGPAPSTVTPGANGNSPSRDVDASYSRSILAIVESSSTSTTSAPAVDRTAAAATAVSATGGAVIRSEEISTRSLPPPKRHHSTFSNVASAQTQAQQVRGDRDTPSKTFLSAAHSTAIEINSESMPISATSPTINKTEASPVIKHHLAASKADSKAVAVQFQDNEVSSWSLESASTEDAHGILLSAIDVTGSFARVSDSADAPNGHQHEKMDVIAPKGSYPPASIVIGEALRNLPSTPSWTPTTSVSSASLSASPVSPVPPALPKRSPFRSAPIPYVSPFTAPLP